MSSGAFSWYMAVMPSMTASVTSWSSPESQASSNCLSRARDWEASKRMVTSGTSVVLSQPSLRVVKSSKGM